MGSAFVAVSNDANASFINPAGLNQIRGKKHLELINPMVVISSNGIDTAMQALETNFDDSEQPLKNCQSYLMGEGKNEINNQYIKIEYVSVNKI